MTTSRQAALVVSNVRQYIEVFVIFVFSSLAEPDLLFRFDEFDAFDPLDHLVSKLILNPQPKRRSIYFRKRLAVHLESDKALRLENILDQLRIVIETAVERLAE